MDDLVEIIWYRLITAISTIPSLDDWQQVLFILIAYAGVALTIGFVFKFTSFEPVTETSSIIKAIANSLFMPAITEELFFRVLWLPHRSENFLQPGLFTWSAIALIAFIIYHPLNGLTFFPVGLPTFTNPVFLVLAALLGISCTFSYLQSGSVWTAIAIHWIVVSTWLVLFGGWERLNSSALT